MDPLLVSMLQSIVTSLQRIEAKIEKSGTKHKVEIAEIVENTTSVEGWSPDGIKWYSSDPGTWRTEGTIPPDEL